MNRQEHARRRDFLLSLGAAATAAATRAARAAEGAKSKIRIGQIGVGHGHATKLSVYRASDEYEVVGLVEPNEALRREAANQAPFRDLPWMSLPQLLAVPGLQAVLVETEVRDLLNVAELCVDAGKHIHLDKPAGESFPQFERIIAAAKRQNLLVQLGYMYRYNPGVELLREFIKHGWLGELFELHAVMSKVVDAASRRSLASYRGGIMFELGCHIVDLTVGILGEPQEVIGVHQHVAAHEDSLLDNMLAVLRYPRAIATVKSSAQEIEGFARRHLVVCGDQGTLQIQPLDDPVVRLALAEPHGNYRTEYQEVRLPEFTRYQADAHDMAAILRGEKETDFSYDHELAVQRTLLKACRLPLNA